MLETLKEWDRELLIFLNNLGSENFDVFWVFITQIESWIFLFVLFLFIFFKYYKKKNALLLAGITIVTFSISFGLKYFTKALIERLRPNNIPELSENIRILQYPKDFSFFSGHASVSFAVTFFVIFSLRKHTKWAYVLFIWPILFSYSRIYVGVHFPSDILVGAIIGVLIGIMMYYVSLKLMHKKKA